MLCVWLSGPSYHSLPRGRAIFSSFIYVGIMLYCVFVLYFYRGVLSFPHSMCEDHVVFVYLYCICTEGVLSFPHSYM